MDAELRAGPGRGSQTSQLHPNPIHPWLGLGGAGLALREDSAWNLTDCAAGADSRETARSGNSQN